VNVTCWSSPSTTTKLRSPGAADDEQGVALVGDARGRRRRRERERPGDGHDQRAVRERPHRGSGLLRGERRADDLRAEALLFGHHGRHVEGDRAGGRRVRSAAGTLRARNSCSNAPGMITPSITAVGLCTRNVCGTPHGMKTVVPGPPRSNRPSTSNSALALDDEEDLVLAGVDVPGRAEALGHRRAEDRQRAVGRLSGDEQLEQAVAVPARLAVLVRWGRRVVSGVMAGQRAPGVARWANDSTHVESGGSIGR
jgi:hypothetical protein